MLIALDDEHVRSALPDRKGPPAVRRRHDASPSEQGGTVARRARRRSSISAAVGEFLAGGFERPAVASG